MNYTLEAQLENLSSLLARGIDLEVIGSGALSSTIPAPTVELPDPPFFFLDAK